MNSDGDPPDKKPKRSAAAERKAAKRAAETEEQTAHRKAKDAQSKAAKKAAETEEQAAQRKGKNAQCQAAKKAAETEEQAALRKAKDAQRKAAKRKKETSEQTIDRLQQMALHSAEIRASETPEQTTARQQQDAQRHAVVRAAETPEQRAGRNRQNRQRMARNYNAAQSSITMGDGLKSHEILDGTFSVRPLQETVDTIGTMTHICAHCGALKFQSENSEVCCRKGKVDLPVLPRPPDTILQLFTGTDHKSKVFRQHARSINNAVCLSSLQVNESRLTGYNPCVVFQGQVKHRLGPIQHEDGEQPCYAQLFLHDPGLELTARYDNMYIPASTSAADRTLLQEILHEIQDELHMVNPFIQDFKQILEIPEEQISEGTLVISAKQPTGEHQRRYNAQINLNEVRILTNSGPHDIVVQKRGGGLQYLSVLNPKGMPLRFTLLFPLGTYGWDPETRHTEGDG